MSDFRGEILEMSIEIRHHTSEIVKSSGIGVPRV
jgi:hypothetical protein